MDTQHTETAHNHNPNVPGASRANETTGAKWRDLVRRARMTATRLPTQLEAQMKRNPITALGVACLAGTGVGIVFSSRILRTIFTAAASAGAVELIRAYVRQNAFRADAA